MYHKAPITELGTHNVTNQPPALEEYNAFDSDTVLKEAVEREQAGWASEKLHHFGERVGSAELIHLGQLANQNVPQLHCFNRFGERIDEVEYHPAYHSLMEFAFSNHVHSIAWTEGQGGHVAHAALLYLLSQAEPGVCCPVSMTYASVPALRRDKELSTRWEPHILTPVYDRRFVPIVEKVGMTLGMAMTEKQGGSDVRSNTTCAHEFDTSGTVEEYLLTGHKWFCSAPMSDAFLTLAQTSEGLSCFLLPRWRPDGTRNTFLIQRLKDKLGNRANASAEIEYCDSWAQLLGPKGQGIQTIIEMVNHTRLDTAVAAASLMRQSVALAIHHAEHRLVFSKKLSEQPLMQNVLADLAIESEAATVLAMRTARSFDEAKLDVSKKGLSRLMAAVTKYWLNKRTPNLVYEAMECHGGSGYVEESLMPRLYREAPLNSIWEGSGNIISLDVVRSVINDIESIDKLIKEIEQASVQDKRLDTQIKTIKRMLHLAPQQLESQARRLAEMLALALQASLLIRYAPSEIAQAFCSSRLSEQPSHAYGNLTASTYFRTIIERHSPNHNK